MEISRRSVLGGALAVGGAALAGCSSDSEDRKASQQGDTASTLEVNLALAILGVRNVDFATVWGQGHTMAELTGSPVTDFIQWVRKSVA
ncbi:twin-arginine translocation signal domain-containing protein [Actinomadura parmotrematis]|uniref:Twin-arginine translocation signal domain-containing protein n=1 Tax=Actinomadura parmotrematis TaxID=2864039 RepID=A0ABS7FVI1_9ACTN|nr:twin-arginine translocation signal domain-containing protein [Actinomadura parmotrematis]MBW8484431.1 twin-arginine translocation signal domain-containing protein [Actinomadura parmotrematis]